MSNGTLHAVILAGGSGTRFWPLSRELMPKQLLSIVGDRSMLALTLERIGRIVPQERCWIVTTHSQAGEIRRELRYTGLDRVNVVVEPCGKNTAPAIGLAAVHVLRQHPNATVAVFPSDHHIRQPDRFVEFIQDAERLAGDGWLVTLGIGPTRPETGYGYIQRGAPLENMPGGSACAKSFRVLRFAEKPDLETAKAYLRSGDFYWNAGIFVWRADRFLEQVRKHLPEHHTGLLRIASLLADAPQRGSAAVDEVYRGFAAISVDYAIMERSDRVAVLPAEMGWSDVGSWASLREILEKDDQGNILQGDVLALDTTRSLVHAEDRLVATLGVDGLVVVDTADALLICPEERSQDVKAISDRLRRENRPEAIIHREVLKPWGAYRVLDHQDGYQVKWLDVRPGERLSYQSHEHRAEHWAVVRGIATVTLDDRVREIPSGEHVYIPMRSKHRLENRTREMLRVVEVQSGDYLGEDDIVRYDDDYGRE